MPTYYILENTSLESEVMYGNRGGWQGPPPQGWGGGPPQGWGDGPPRFPPRGGFPDRGRGGFHGRGSFEGGFPGGCGPFSGGPPGGKFQPRPRNNFQSHSGQSSGPSNQPEVIKVKGEMKEEPQDQQQQVDVKCRPCSSHFDNNEVSFRSAHISEY